MISIWPNMHFDCEDYKEFQNAGLLLGDASTYDAFAEEARALFWSQVENEFLEGGFDSWWCDSTEPFSGSDWSGESIREPWERFTLVGGEHKKYLDPTYANLFALKHAQGIYENQRNSTSEKRVVNLTRSGYAGSQKYGTILWSGDISANWETLRKQIAEGLNVCMSGLPYWTLDIGGFFVVGTDHTKRGCGCSDNPNRLWFWDGHYNDGSNDLGYRELYTRWLEYAVFLPIFRSHGTDTPREIWNFGEKGTMFYDSIEKFIRLRYRLLPYIYSMAADITFNQGTMLRSLLFDFSADNIAKNICDQFMFGRSLLICPIHKPMYFGVNSTPLQQDISWKCYLPHGCDWYNFWTNELYSGGKYICVEANIDMLPIFVRAGSIIPMEAKNIYYANQYSELPFEIHIYPGADTEFILYEDSGDSYSYEQGEYYSVALKWHQSSKTFSIEEISYWHDKSIRGRIINLFYHQNKSTIKTSIDYKGHSITVNF
jgi:alpha-D-xyloside xylohydrolase